MPPLVFRPPGSVQALWALGTPPVRQLIEDLQTRVTGEVLIPQAVGRAPPPERIILCTSCRAPGLHLAQH
ncbi:hypothetical protein ACWECR_35185 [Streptomyces sp. NPDC005056]